MINSHDLLLEIKEIADWQFDSMVESNIDSYHAKSNAIYAAVIKLTKVLVGEIQSLEARIEQLERNKNEETKA